MIGLAANDAAERNRAIEISVCRQHAYGSRNLQRAGHRDNFIFGACSLKRSFAPFSR